MKFLCVCQYGHSRSVALVRTLHGLHQPAIAVGWRTAGEEALRLLIPWADKIVIIASGPPLEAALCPSPPGTREKIVQFNLGPDRWSNPYHPELRALCEKFVRENFPEIVPSLKGVLGS